MADTKISDLTVTTTLDGSELLPVVQSSTTKTANVSSLLTSFVPTQTANSIVFLNGSKRLTYKSDFTFDGITFTAPKAVFNENIVSANAIFSGNVQIGNDLTVTSNVSIAKNLNVTGNLITSNRVGIGTGTPTAQLEIAGNVKTSSNVSSTLTLGRFSSTVPDAIINGNDSSFLAVQLRGVEQFRIGNAVIGIGRTNPSYPLDILGNGHDVQRLEGTSASGYTGTTYQTSGGLQYSIGVGGASEATIGAPSSFYIYNKTSNILVLKSDIVGNVLLPGNVTIGRQVVSPNLYSTGTITAAGIVKGGAIVSGNIYSTSSITSTGSITGATVTATGTVSGATVTATGTVSGATVSSTGTMEPAGDIKASSNVYVTSGTTKIGYNDSFNTVTQTSSKANPVTINATSGRIIMHNAALAAGAEVSFIVTNSLICQEDVVLTCISAGATAGAYTCQVDQVANSNCRISLSNLSTGSLSEAVNINFILFKAAAR